MKIAIFGSQGQLGTALTERLQSTHTLSLFSHEDVDIGDRDSVRASVAATRPAVVINAAAFTDVDGCESDPVAAYQSNALGPRWLGEAANACGALLVQLSTDYVFPGRPGGEYHEFDEVRGIQVYGQSKLAGEREAVGTSSRCLIVRTAWVYGGPGRNFVNAILARARQGEPLRVVSDQIGSPSYASDVAAGIAALIDEGVGGTVHLCNDGQVSRFGLAAEILHATETATPIVPIRSTELHSPAVRPEDTSLISLVAPSLGIYLRPWQEALHDHLRRA